MAARPEIEIDHELLVRTAKDLRLVAENLAAASERIAGAGLDGEAFGRMNAWLVPPIEAVADRSAELITTSGKVVGAFGTATDAAAEDWAAAEESMITAINSVGSTLGEVQP